MENLFFVRTGDRCLTEDILKVTLLAQFFTALFGYFSFSRILPIRSCEFEHGTSN